MPLELFMTRTRLHPWVLQVTSQAPDIYALVFPSRSLTVCPIFVAVRVDLLMPTAFCSKNCVRTLRELLFEISMAAAATSQQAPRVRGGTSTFAIAMLLPLEMTCQAIDISLWRLTPRWADVSRTAAVGQ